MFEGLLRPMHLIIILVVAVFVLGPGRVAKMGGSLGKSVRGFKKAASIIKGIRRF